MLWKARVVEFQNHFAGFGRIILAIEAAERSRAPVQRLADRHSDYIVCFVLGSAGLALLLSHNLRSTISVIIVTRACGISVGTPWRSSAQSRGPPGRGRSSRAAFSRATRQNGYGTPG